MKELKLPDSGLTITVKEYFTRGAHKLYLTKGFVQDENGKSKVVQNLGHWEEIADEMLIEHQIKSISDGSEVSMDFINNLSKTDSEVLSAYLVEIRKQDQESKSKKKD